MCACCVREGATGARRSYICCSPLPSHLLHLCSCPRQFNPHISSSPHTPTLSLSPVFTRILPAGSRPDRSIDQKNRNLASSPHLPRRPFTLGSQITDSHAEPLQEGSQGGAGGGDPAAAKAKFDDGGRRRRRRRRHHRQRRRRRRRRRPAPFQAAADRRPVHAPARPALAGGRRRAPARVAAALRGGDVGGAGPRRRRGAERLHARDRRAGQRQDAGEIFLGGEGETTWRR